MEETFATPDALRRAAKNIILEMGRPPAGNVLLIYSQEKSILAEQIMRFLDQQGLQHRALVLDRCVPAGLEKLRQLVLDVTGRWGMLLLFQPEHADILFEMIGRPDQGLHISQQFFFCDWLADLPSLVRTYDVDWDELSALRTNLVKSLDGAKEMRVTTAAGTDIVLYPREWRASHGEVYTAPLEGLAQGRILVDGCAYSGPPRQPFWLQIEQGRVANLAALVPGDPQQKWALTDLTRDANASVLAELGIGINPGALASGSLMEAEQALGTCHFGFGNNLAYGGANASINHLDLVVLSPTILVDGCVLVDSGFSGDLVVVVERLRSNLSTTTTPVPIEPDSGRFGYRKIGL